MERKGRNLVFLCASKKKALLLHPQYGLPIYLDMPKRVIVSYEKMSEELQTLFKEKYPRGYADYMEDLMTIDKPDGTSFTAVSVSTEDAVYLIKMPVRVDGYDDAEKEMFEGEGSDSDENGGDDVFPDDGTENFKEESESDDEE